MLAMLAMLAGCWGFDIGGIGGIGGWARPRISPTGGRHTTVLCCTMATKAGQVVPVGSD